MKKILLISPAYNEEKNILEVYNLVSKYNKVSKANYNFIVINDGSNDRTYEICQKNNIPVINLIHNLGIGGAVQTGYKYAYENNYDIAIQFDGDGQHDIKHVEKLIKPIIAGQADMVIGSRYIDKKSSVFLSSKIRRLGIFIISIVIEFKTKKKIYDTTSGFRAVNKELISLFADSYPVEYPEPVSTVKVLNKKYIVKEIPVSMNERKEGSSSIRTWKSIYYMMNVVLSILIMDKRMVKK